MVDGEPVVILWPFGVGAPSKGYCYGWSSPLICVIGMIDVESSEEATHSLQVAYDALPSHAREATGCAPIVLGYCELPNDNVDLSSTLQQSFGLKKSRTSIVYYQLPDLSSMEIFALDFRIYDPPERMMPPHFGSTATYESLDPSIPSPTTFSLQQIVLERLNHGPSIDNLARIQLGVFRDPRRSPRSVVSSFLTRISDKRLSSHRPTTSLSRPPLVLPTILVEGFSTFFYQVLDRTQHGIALPSQFPSIYRRDKPISANTISHYVNFWNDVWLILNDIIIGIALGSFICENSDALSSILGRHLQYILIEFPKQALVWLNNWPAGLKLNTELSQFYCHSFLGVVVIWGRILESTAIPHLAGILYTIGAMGFFGLTMISSLLSDLLSIFTAHLYICYVVSGAVFRYQLMVAASLWNLFRGKRYNILRRRKDSWDYDVDQLLLGTILFTLVSFLSPTVGTYYALFALTRFVIVLGHALADTILVLMNHFPLFALLLRVKSPFRMPGGVIYRFDKAKFSPRLEIRPLPFMRIFDHYVYLGSQLFSHYHPLRLFRLVLTGGKLTTIPRSLIRLRPKQSGGKEQ